MKDTYEERVKAASYNNAVAIALAAKYKSEKDVNEKQIEHLQAYLDENRSKYYSVIDGFGPLTEMYVKNSGAYVDFPKVSRKQVLEDAHFLSPVNDDAIYAGDETSPLGAVVRLARDFRNKSTSSNPTKHLYSTPRPWRMNDSGAVLFLGTTYDTIAQKPTYKCVDHAGNVTYKIFDNYEIIRNS